LFKLQNRSAGMHANLLLWLCLSIFVCVVFLLALRVGFLHYSISSFSPSLLFIDDFWQVLFTGLRFDIAIVMRAFLPVYLLSLLALPFPHIVGKIILRIGCWWGAILVALMFALSVINLAYIEFFNEPLNAFAIESLIHYDVDVVISTIMGSGSLLIYATVLILLPCIVWLMLKLSQWQQRLNFFSTVGVLQSLSLAIVGFFLVMALGRGSFGAFPLSHRHLIVSVVPGFNNAVPNGLVSSYYAVLEYLDSKTLVIANDEDGRMLFEAFHGYSASEGELWPQLFTQTPASKVLEHHPPNVVLNIMESLGAELLRPEFNQSHDWAAGLRGHLDDDLVMTRFLPAHNSTQSSLINLLGNINYPTVTQSKYKNISLMTSVAKVFKKAGYRTLFVYTGFEGERNIANYFQKQGFDEFIGASSLQRIYPDMETNIWGGEDRYVFEYITQRLLEKPVGGPPLLIISLSINNHPPYIVLDGMNDAHLTLDPLVREKLAQLPAISMSTYEYSNHYLGGFISQIKSSKRKNDTIIAATGDHGTRGLRSSSGSALRNISVPFYLYIPPPYVPESELDILQIASHKDLFPTLYHLSLSEASYPNLGRNLFDLVTVDKTHSFAMTEQYFVDLDGAVMKTRPSNTYPFSSLGDLQLEDAIAYKKTDLVNRGQAYAALKDWMMRKQLTKGLAQ
jgi:phosphoglycerol transferase MdoB-like AlkP superfamily enzyme